jgi:hypothetical protein
VTADAPGIPLATTCAWIGSGGTIEPVPAPEPSPGEAARVAREESTAPSNRISMPDAIGTETFLLMETSCERVVAAARTAALDT